MNTLSPTTDSESVSAREIEAVERALIDASARKPVLFFYAASLSWLLLASALGLISTIKLYHPGFLADYSWLTYGRVWPAYLNALIYGWAMLVGMGTATWMMARMCRVSLKRPGLLIVGGVLWNIGVTIGIVSILSGNSQGIPWLEFPRSVAAILFIAYALIGVWAIVMFSLRRPGHDFISLWYFLGAFFWFPWLFGAAYWMVSIVHVPGVLQAIVTAWFAHNLITLWFGSVGLGAVYYLIPKVIGRPVHSYSLATIGFWSFAIFAGWGGMTKLAGGPVPVWMVTVGIVAGILMMIPVATVTVNYVMTMSGRFSMVYHSPTIRFAFLGAIVWSVGTIVAMFAGLRSAGSILNLTQFSIGQTHLMLYLFFSMVMFGSMYYIVPRLVGCEWLSATFIRIHFWGTAYGMGLVVAMMLIGGLVQGLTQADADATIISSVKKMSPYFVGRAIGWIMLTFSHVVFAFHFLLMLLRLGRPGGEPTLFEALKHEGSEL